MDFPAFLLSSFVLFCSFPFHYFLTLRSFLFAYLHSPSSVLACFLSVFTLWLICIFPQVLGIIFFNEVPGVLKVVGVLLVLASIMSLGVRGFLDARRLKAKHLQMESSDIR